MVVGVLGLLMLDESLNDEDDDDDEAEKARALVGARGLSVIGLGVGISLDELVVGFTIGFAACRPVITTIVIQAFLAIMLGQFLGRKARDGNLRLSAERLTNGTKLVAGGVLVTLSAGLLLGPQSPPTSSPLHPPPGARPGGTFGGQHRPAVSRRQSFGAGPAGRRDVPGSLAGDDRIRLRRDLGSRPPAAGSAAS